VPPIASIVGQYDAGASIQVACVFADKAGGGEQAAIRRCVTLAPLGPSVQILQFDAQHGCLERIQAKIAADYFVVVFGASPMTAQQSYLVGQRWVVGGDHTPVAKRPQVFRREEAEAAQVAD
jgi:hypothetical protein